MSLASITIALVATATPFAVAAGWFSSLPDLNVPAWAGKWLVTAGLGLYLLAFQLLPAGVEATQGTQDADGGETVEL